VERIVIKAPKGRCEECTLKNAVFVPSELHSSKVLFLAEAPGYHEAQDGRPLVGVAGQDFNDIVEECGGKREDGNYMNAVTCRPTKVVDGKTYNRTPTDVEIKFCNDRLVEEIESLQPVIIVCMGKVPYVALGGDPKAAMKDVVGSTFAWRGKYDVIVTYHPAAIAHSGGRRTPRGKEIRDEIKKVVAKALATKPSARQLIFDIKAPTRKDTELQPILVEMNRQKEKCLAWWDSEDKCKSCKQKFYCYPE
jgi:DNA polymerase